MGKMCTPCPAPSSSAVSTQAYTMSLGSTHGLECYVPGAFGVLDSGELRQQGPEGSVGDPAPQRSFRDRFGSGSGESSQRPASLPKGAPRTSNTVYVGLLHWDS